MHPFSLFSPNTAGYIPLAVYVWVTAALQLHAITIALLAQPFGKGTAQNMVLLPSEVGLEFSFPCQAVFQLKKKKKLINQQKIVWYFN